MNVTLDNRTNIVNNIRGHIANKPVEKPGFKNSNPLGTIGLTDTGSKQGEHGIPKQKSTTLGTRKILNQMLARMTPMSATNASAKHKATMSAFSGYNSRSMHKSLKPSRSIDLRESRDSHNSNKTKAFRKNNLSVTVDQSRQAYGFNPSTTTTPVDKM